MVEEATVTPASAQKISPWLFVPFLYFLQAIPVSLVQDVSPILFKDFGISNESIARWTSVIALPWALQMLVGPMVDLNWTKRKWVVAGETIMTCLIAAIALLIHLPHSYAIVLAAMFVLAIVSTFSNAAMDGFYILSLPKSDQAMYAGVQTTCYRLGALFCKGLLVILAGLIEEKHGVSMGWGVALLVGAAIYGVGAVENRLCLPRPPLDIVRPHEKGNEGRNSLNQTLILVGIGLAGYFFMSSIVRLGAEAIWKIFDGTATGPLHGWMLSNDPKMIGFSVGNSGIGAEVGQLIGCGLALVFLFRLIQVKIKGTEFGHTFAAYFRNEGIVWILAFLMFYRFGEAMVSKMSPLFLKDAVIHGGLGLSTETVGLVKGTYGMIGIVLGGLLGGYIVGKVGLRKSFWTIAILMHIPNFLYLWASYAHPHVVAIYVVDFFDQFGYGFGFAGYIIFQMSVARRGKYPTAHYALGVGIGALFISVAGVVSGIIEGNFGWHWFFIAVVIMTIPGLLTLLVIPLDESQGEAQPDAA